MKKLSILALTTTLSSVLVFAADAMDDGGMSKDSMSKNSMGK